MTGEPMNERFCRWIAAGMLLTIVGCASTAKPAADAQAVQPPATKPADEDAAMEKPFMFNEADLPAGFPKPGPVGVVMIKQYPAARAAMVRSDAINSNDEGRMFRPLFDHIKRNKIEMTSPVQIEYSSGEKSAEPTAMAFFYGQPDLKGDTAQSKVKAVETPPMKVVSIGVRGSYDSGHMAKAVDRLNQWLAERPGQYVVTGPPRVLGYNSPFVPSFMRYAEVQLPLADAKP